MEFKVQQIVLDDPEQHNGDSQNAALSVKKQALIAICDGCEELSSSLSGAEPTSPPSSFQNEGFGTHYATSLQLSDQEDELTVAVLLSKQAEDMPDEGDPTTRSMRVRSTGRPCGPQPSFVPNHDAGENFPRAAIASPTVPLPTWHCPSPVIASSPCSFAIAVPSSFPCPPALAPKSGSPHIADRSTTTNNYANKIEKKLASIRPSPMKKSSSALNHTSQRIYSKNLPVIASISIAHMQKDVHKLTSAPSGDKDFMTVTMPAQVNSKTHENNDSSDPVCPAQHPHSCPRTHWKCSTSSKGKNPFLGMKGGRIVLLLYILIPTCFTGASFGEFL